MKPVSIIISAILLLFSIARLANSCSKREKRQKGLQFRQWLAKLDTKKDSIVTYEYMPFEVTDSIGWMVDHRKSFDKTLDSSIQYYQDVYKQDEPRYKIYLKILYEYKKLSYLYADWIKTCRVNENPAKKEKDYHPLSLMEFQRKERELMFGMSRYNIELISID
ncbi:MAG: hypothetical protein QM687_13745 [Ferruginibacter sp.]